MDRRKFIKRSIAGGLAALVGLPEGKAEKKSPLDEAIPKLYRALKNKPEPAMTIRHTGKFRLYREMIEVPPKEPPWRHYKLGALFVEINGLWVTGDEWSKLAGDGLVRLELKSIDYDLTAVGFWTNAAVRGWKGAPTPPDNARYCGDFTFRLIEPLEQILVKKRYPSKKDHIVFPGASVRELVF